MRKLLLGSALIALLTLSGCKPPQMYGGKLRTKNYTTIVSLSPSTTEILSTATIPIKGRTKACDWPASVVSQPVYADLKPDYEALNRVAPDMLVLDKDLYGESELRKLEQTKATLFLFKATTVDEFIKELYTLGSVVGKETEISTYADKISAAKAASEGEQPSPKPKAVLLLSGPGGHHMIAGTKSFQADIMRIAGMEPVGPDSARFEVANAEFILSQNPTIIVTAGGTKDIIGDTRLASLNAVKNLNLYGLDSNLVVRRGGRVDQLIQQMHKGLILTLAKKK